MRCHVACKKFTDVPPKCQHLPDYIASHPRDPLLIATAVRTLTLKNQKDFTKNDCSVDEADKEEEFTETDIDVTQN